MLQYLKFDLLWYVWLYIISGNSKYKFKIVICIYVLNYVWGILLDKNLINKYNLLKFWHFEQLNNIDIICFSIEINYS